MLPFLIATLQQDGHFSNATTNVLQGQPQIRGMTCSTDAYGVHADFRLHNKPVNAMWEFSKVVACAPMFPCADMLSSLLCWAVMLHFCMALSEWRGIVQVPEVHVTAQALLPSTSVIAFTLGNGLSFTTFVNTVPINENRTVNRFALIRRLSLDKLGIFNMDAWDRFARQAMIRCASWPLPSLILHLETFQFRCSTLHVIDRCILWCSTPIQQQCPP